MPADSDLIVAEREDLGIDRTLYKSLSERSKHEDFIRRAVDLLVERVVFGRSLRTSKVVERAVPSEIKKAIDLKPRDGPISHDELLGLMADVARYSVNTAHPYFVNQLYSSVDPYGSVGQWLTDALNPSVYTYEVAPVFTLMEEEVLKEMRVLVGWKDGEGDGIFCPGGSIANGYAISCARFHFYPEIKTKGVYAVPKLTLYTSELAHYSTKKLAAFMGIGDENCVLIKTDKYGKIDVEDLEAKIIEGIEEGAAPFLVTATAGTTVFGAFDPLVPIAALCKKYNLWLHVDAAWGGGALMSKKHRHLLNGIELADSVTWNPHKLLAAPQQCSTFLIRHKNVLKEGHSCNAKYLFQKDKFYDTSYDTGDKHIQCGRRADVLKFWFMWKAKGSDGFENHIDTLFDNARFFLEQIRNREGFELVIEKPECTNIMFWYVPRCLRGCENESDYRERLHKVAPKIKELMIKEGSMMVTYQPQGDLVNFFRIVFQNSALDHKDMIYFVNEFERLGRDILV
ncbi:cysteine sulfinic acid decarboxylase [Bombyx mori]|uniref:Aspartate decarboxylase n=3 Tax=Bombyx TaxID=7090 RepID=A0A0C5QEV9_BOMMO|nr:cysteine sulfinic acid decarboxylase [Bombyx mori]AJQ30183.1 aspartate decarboxylase [Bombyx mori]